ncbi:glycosyltransferase family 4 protein [Candidatus Dependentiae bacterium]
MKKTSNAKLNNLKILIIHSEKKFGGGEVHTLELYKNLVKNNININILVVKKSVLETKLIKEQLPYYTYNQFSIFKNLIQPGLYFAILKICNQNNTNIIHCNIHRETLPAKKVAHKLKIQVILTRHVTEIPKLKYLKNLDGLIGVNPNIISNIKKQNLNIKNYIFIPPFFDENKFLNFKQSTNKYDFFKTNFNLNIQNIPIICTIANIFKSKNHTILLKAVSNLIHKKNKPIEVLLVGDGTQKSKLKFETKKLNIEKYVHFLGFTNKVTEILYHSDIKILPSKKEAFGIVLLEAALLKKPLICATKTGAANLIVFDKKTGLLFENNNLDSLIKKIESLLNNTEFCKKLGQNAYEHTYKIFSVNKNLNKITRFYKKILTEKL